MRGNTMIENTCHARWAGGPEREFERADVIAFGKHARYNDSVTRYLVRLTDGAEVMVIGTLQPVDDRTWLRKLAKRCPQPITNRDVPQAERWIDLACPRCKSTDVVPARNFGREVKPYRGWCAACGWLEEPSTP